MRLGLNVFYDALDHLDVVEEADRLGFDSVWASESYGTDVVSVLGWIAGRTQNIALGSAIMQMPARTPAMTAMTAATLSELSGGRFRLGLGVSGPQVVEGWHGQPYGKPLGKTREYVSIVRRALAREYVEHDGEHYQLPYEGPGSTGLGKPLKLITKPQYDIPFYLAAIGPKNVSLAAEIADGLLPVFVSPEHFAEVFAKPIAEGLGRSENPDKHFDVAASLFVQVTDVPEQAVWAAKPTTALYIGGMGARGKNFYHELATRYGYGEAADAIQDAYLDGRKTEAVAAVPDELVHELNLIGPIEHIRERIAAFEEAGVTTLLLMTADVATLRALAEL